MSIIPHDYMDRLFGEDDMIPLSHLTGKGSIDPESYRDEIVKIITESTGTPIHGVVGKPVKTTKRCSKMEFTRVIVEIAKYIESLDDLSEIMIDTSFGGPINTADLALRWVQSGKIDAVIDRRIEKVLFSELFVNPQWESQLMRYNERRNESISDSMQRIIDLK